MKLLLDQNLSFRLCERLKTTFPDSQQVRLVGLAQADDKVVWEYAKGSGFVILSQDADFADLAAFHGPPPKVIWLRCGNQTTDFIERLLRSNVPRILEFGKDASAGCLEIY